MSEPAPERLEELEAKARMLMSAHAAIKPRGYNTIRERHTLHQRIDQLLDAHNAWQAIADLDADLDNTA